MGALLPKRSGIERILTISLGLVFRGRGTVKFRYSKHLHEELGRRKIPRKLLEQVLQGPEQKVPELDNVTCYQSQVNIAGKPYLLRVMVNETVDPHVVVTVYRTSKISKYWRRP